MLRICRVQKIPPERFHEKFAIQLNDTHPSIAVAELMRLLVDEMAMDWERAWSITRQTFAYTNHTLLPEALERWPLPMFGAPAAAASRDHLRDQRAHPRRGAHGVLRRRGAHRAGCRSSTRPARRYVRMAHLASVGSHAINGVAALHSELLKSDVLRDFAELWPEKFSNKTNGVTPRRWMVLANPRLAALHHAAHRRRVDPRPLPAAQARAARRRCGFPRRVAQDQAREQDGARGARSCERTGVTVDPAAIFDVQVKRIHEYKRQHLNILHVIGLYHRLKTDPKFTMEPRVFVFGGKAAPGYHLAKLIIRLITAAAEIINRDPGVRDLIKVVYLPNFNVTNGQKIYPAADLSEQISTAGKEASGTGNMKFQMNGALTIGTVDGANIEICEEVGVENFFLFGLEAHEVAAKRKAGYRPMEFVENSEELQAVIQLIRDGFFSRGNTTQFLPLIDNLIYHDPYFVLRGLPVVRGLPVAGRPDLPRQGKLDAHVDPELRALRQVLLGSHDPRVLQRDLEGEAGQGAAHVARGSEGRPRSVNGDIPHFLGKGDRAGLNSGCGRTHVRDPGPSTCGFSAAADCDWCAREMALIRGEGSASRRKCERAAALTLPSSPFSLRANRECPHLNHGKSCDPRPYRYDPHT